jgi:hypothetical protein
LTENKLTADEHRWTLKTAAKIASRFKREDI